MGNAGVSKKVKEPPHFVLAEPVGGRRTVDITGADFHHLHNVLRRDVGHEVVLVDRLGACYLGRISAIFADRARVEIVQQRVSAPEFPLIVGAGIIKEPRMDLMVEKAAELGATEFWPVACERSVVKDVSRLRLERWNRLAVAAAKQCLSVRPMEIKPVVSLEKFLEHSQSVALRVICRQGAPSLGNLVRERKPSSLSLLCGPEGDFSEEEFQKALQYGFVAAGLGRNRLRSETAVITALSVVHDAVWG